MRKLLIFLLFPVLCSAQVNTARMNGGINAQTGTTYTILSSDSVKLLTFNNAAPVAVTLPAPITFVNGTVFSIKNLGAGTVTVTPTASLIDGFPSLAFATGQGADIYNDGTNYRTEGYCTVSGCTHSGTEAFTNLTVSGTLTCKNIEGTRCVDGTNAQGWAGATFPNWVDSAIADCGATSCIVQIAANAPAGNASVTYFVTQDGIATIQPPANVTLVDNRNSATAYANIMFNSIPSNDPGMLTVYNHLSSPAHTSGAIWATSQVTGATAPDGGTASSITAELDINGTLTSVAGAAHVAAIEASTSIRSTGQTIADVRGLTSSVNLDRAASTTNVTDATSIYASPCRNLSSTATIVDCYSLQAAQPTLGTTRNYAAYLNGSILMPNNVNFDVVNSGGTAARFITFNVDNTTFFRPRGTDQAGDFQFADTTGTIPIMTLGTSGGVVLAGVCISGPLYRWHVECPVAGDIIAKFRNTSATGFGAIFTPGVNTNYGIAVTKADNSANTFQVLGSGQVQLASTISTIGGASQMGLTLKKGSGAGNYTTASTTYVVPDSTNLCYTVTIPVGWKLGIQASGSIGTSTAIAAASAALTDNAACSTANAGLLTEAQTDAGAIGATAGFSLSWVITGDGAAHNVALQVKTAAGADAVLLLNSSATALPTMVFTLMPSN